jgi:hypothetical protein
MRRSPRLRYSWRPILVLPGVELDGPVEGGRLVAVGPDDRRYAEVSANPHVKQFLSAFVTPFGEALSPSLIIRRLASKPKADDIASFRDVIALPRVIEARVSHWRSTRAATSERSGAVWSDYFDLYPAMVTSDGMISIRTGAMSDLRFQESAHKFRGQVAPALFDARGMRSPTDKTLEDALLEAWRSQPTKGDKARARFRRRLFRSTAFAVHALRVSSVVAGRSETATWLSLFVAAFETLVHPDSRKVVYTDVTEAIKAIRWKSSDLRSKNARVRYIGKGGKVVYGRSTRPVQIYQRLYRLRNQWLHGDELRTDRLERRCHAKWGSLEIQIPVLYRHLVLSQLLSHGLVAPPKPLSSSAEIIQAMTQNNFEKPLL